MFGLKVGEIIFIVLIIALLFGASRLPQLARSIGATRKAFKDGFRDDEPTSSTQVRSAHSDDDLAAELARRNAARATSE